MDEIDSPAGAFLGAEVFLAAGFLATAFFAAGAFLAAAGFAALVAAGFLAAGFLAAGLTFSLPAAVYCESTSQDMCLGQ
jgi:hypothetical protein